MSTDTASKDKTVDGRRLRSDRSRQAIIDAGLALIDEGVLVPTAQQISERAGVGIRSFFRHFADMETLFAAADEQSRAGYEALFIGGDREGTVEERLLHAVERHAQGYETQRNVILSAAAQRWRYAILRKHYARYQRGLRKDLDDWLPELKSLPTAEREAIDAIASAEMWLRLRDHQGLGKRAAVETVVKMISRMMST
ncbi:MAG: TetR/AcrR family transcriptional regulator [Halioglobus sp.]